MLRRRKRKKKRKNSSCYALQGASKTRGSGAWGTKVELFLQFRFCSCSCFCFPSVAFRRAASRLRAAGGDALPAALSAALPEANCAAAQAYGSEAVFNAANAGGASLRAAPCATTSTATDVGIGGAGLKRGPPGSAGRGHAARRGRGRLRKHRRSARAYRRRHARRRRACNLRVHLYTVHHVCNNQLIN